jgi:hypothetical protein
MNARWLPVAVLFACLATSAGAETVEMRLSLTAEQVARAGEEICVWLDLGRVAEAARLKDSPRLDAVAVRDAAGLAVPSAVFEDINPFVPSGSCGYVAWQRPATAPAALEVVLAFGAADPPRDATLKGVNLLKNPGFEDPPEKGKPLPPAWAAFQFIEGTLALSDEAARSGSCSLKLQNAAANGRYVIFSQSASTPADWCARRASMWLRYYERVAETSGVGAGSFCRLRRWDEKGFAGDVGSAGIGAADGRGWTEVRVAGRLEPGVRSVDLHMGARAGAPTQTTFFDDFDLQVAPLDLTAVEARPRMVFASEGAVVARVLVTAGTRLFVTHAARLGESSVPVRLRQDFPAEGLKGATLRVSLLGQDGSKPVGQASLPLEPGREHRLPLDVRACRPGRFEVAADVVLSSGETVRGGAAEVEVEPDPFLTRP